MTGKRASLEQRVWQKIQKGSDDECWLWTGSFKGSPVGIRSYGAIRVGGRGSKLMLAHRAVYEIIKGTIPEGFNVCHSCDNPPCCNPSHLFLGTQSDNMRDAFHKGRKKNEPNGKLTLIDVEEIRISYSQGVLKQRELAAKFNVSIPLISLIVTRKIWI